MSDALSGTIERVTFHNPENGFVVLRVKVQGKRGFVTVVGQTPRAVAGEFLDANGRWKQDAEHGEQFQAESLRITPPSSVEGIEKYLGSGLVKGIGPHYARKIVSVFGPRTLQVIDESPSFLREIKGIGPQRLQRIRESWRQQKSVRDIMVFLQSHGIGSGRAVRIYKTYGDQAVELVRANPYRLASDIWGIGFKSADELAQRLGIDRQSPLRAQAALRFVLHELSQQGHCGYPEEATLEQTAALTGISRETIQQAADHLATARAEHRSSSELVREPIDGVTWLFLRGLHGAEVGVARALHLLLRGNHPLPKIDLEAALAWVEKRMRLTLAPTQRAAIRQAASDKVLVITGGPGVGKTTIVRGIVEIFHAKKLKVLLTAPTGRAAKRLAESTGHEAKTIHRLLEFDHSGPQRDAQRPLEVDLLIVDETSMVDVVLMHHLLKALPAHACLLLVGDVDQLPSVGPGLVLADVIASRSVPVVRLTEIFRQAQESGIVQAAHRVHAGALPESCPPRADRSRPGDFFIVEAEQPAAILERVVALVRERIPARFGLDPIRDVQILTPMNRSELGVRNLNQQLQAILNPPREGPAVERFGWTFRLGDKVLQTMNNYDKEVFNGDIGRICRIEESEQELTVDLDGKSVHYDFDELDELSLAYALTIHKAQGSEYPAVVIPLHTQHYLLLQRNLLYTGITRGKALVVLVGSKKALALAVGRHDTARRCTALARRLSE